MLPLVLNAQKARQGSHKPLSAVAQSAVVVAGLTVAAGIAVTIVLLQVRIDPWRLGAFFESLALVLAVFVAFTSSTFTRQLRHWSTRSAGIALALPFSMLAPYLIFALGTHTFSWIGAAKLAAYIAVPTAILLPDRVRAAERVGWRDIAAMVALAVPVSAHWLEGVWTWPQELYFFRPLFCVCVGGYDFMVLRRLEGVGYSLNFFRKGDLSDGFANFLAFGLLAIPLGLALSFIHPHSQFVSPARWALQFLGIYLTIAIPEEFLFRGVLQNFLVKSISHRRGGLFGLLIASVVFGASHLHHAPVPNWRYGILATLAGIFYGNAYRARQRLSASAMTHALVDTVWHFWF